ncbi:enterobactin transporter EntS [Notoacmeibacter ruber]|uniref:Enterobactin transporter EntS n=1 Tax=Notoacmeibacter ruber TaxID=2670375 RepID=A0A3L7JD06_9HYPH|nr:enterobactin transporter EntS [Notoacmeibacter ruber]RLQ88553.1 enterobactin transporter EntS [Notoacmeibacter ruber]
MTLSRLFVDLSLLRENAAFRQVLIARTISIMGLGMLAVSVPVQVYDLTGSSFYVGIVSALDGAGLFAGLLLGGVLSDLYDRRRLILFARSVCGFGFVALAANTYFGPSSVIAICALAFWDGFFGAIGVAALMAAMPNIVGRENIMQAGALGMMAARFATIISPAIGGIVIAWQGVGLNYVIAAVGTLITVLTLLGLPTMVPPRLEMHHPLRMLSQAFSFVLGRRAILAIFAFGSLLTLSSAIRVLFPALTTETYGGGAFEVGLLYSAVPVGATLGAVLSGWARTVVKPEAVMIGMCATAFACVMALGLMPSTYLALPVLALYGYATAIASLLQYSMIQAETPDHYLGRINSLWSAQEALGDIVGALMIGALAQAFLPAGSILVLGAAAIGATAILALLLRLADRRAAAAEPVADTQGIRS